MTIYSPTYRVKIDNTTVTNVTLSGLTITSGRTSIYNQPVAGYANLTLVETGLSAINYDINDSITIEVTNSSGSYINLFGGFITDLTVSVANSGSTAISQRINITATGALARISRVIFTGNLSSQMDGDRIAYLLGLALFNSWNQVPAATAWNTYTATTTWANAENSGYGEIDTPGNYELDSQTGLNNSIYNLCSAAANSALGYLYEDAQGRIGYANSTHRIQYLSANGYVDLDGNQAIGPGLQITKRAGDVRNAITVSYGSTSSSTVTDSDPNSIAIYGELANTFDTTLKHAADATSLAAFYLSIRANPAYEMRQITFPISSPEIDNGDRDSLLNVFMGQPLNINNLPSNMVGGAFQGFVEGWTWTAGLNSLSLTMIVSPLSYSLQPMRWSNIPVNEYWNTIEPTLNWLNATIVA